MLGFFSHENAMRQTKPSITSVSEDVWSRASHRHALLRGLLEENQRNHLSVKLVASDLGISVQHTYRLLKKLREEQTTASLLPLPRGPRVGNRRLAVNIEKIIEEVIKKIYLKREKPTLKQVHRYIECECQKSGFNVPSMKAVRSRVATCNSKTLIKKREGKTATEAAFHQIQGSLEADRPLEIVQIDHTKVDLMLVDDITRASIGRPWLTLVMDIHTRMVLGFLLSLEAPCTTSVALALTQAVLPKDSWRAERLIENSWPTSGIPRCIHVDNGAEFHGRSFERGCEQHGIQIAYRPPATPRYGGHIERLMGTLMHRIQALPGTTFSNVVERGDYRSEERACLSFREFERILALEVLGPYHNEIHRGLGQPPIAKWTSSIETTASRHPLDSQAFLLDFLPYETRVIRRDGVRLFNIQYQDGGLAHLLGRPDTRLRVKYDPRNLSSVYVELPDGDHVRVPYADLRREPITLWEHRNAVRCLKDEGRRSVDEASIFTAIREQRAILDEARGLSREARRNVVRREIAQRCADSPSEPNQSQFPAGKAEDDVDRIPMPPPGAHSGVEIW
ncbi:Mu transposase C-terminal domain-containing protein [Acetobacter oryzifermentans]|uniref:Mu transposase C-terminal domain-containing protein n=1 Tax=Acetobacter oryzifermentans TaxID=1633874 RepID=UPI001FD847F1|nr:Mu transposase C-terminal domain-containing protein [Acetobacter oryzifermentans]